MSALVPIKDHRALVAIERAVEQVRRNVLTKNFEKRVPTFSELSRSWMCRAEAARVRFEQIDWHNSVVSQSATHDRLQLTFWVVEDVCGAVISPIAPSNGGAGFVQFRVDSEAIRDIAATITVSGQIDIHQEEAIALSRYLIGGRRLAISNKIPGSAVETAVFDISGFEFANFDLLRRFVFV